MPGAQDTVKLGRDSISKIAAKLTCETVAREDDGVDGTEARQRLTVLNATVSNLKNQPIAHEQCGTLTD